MSRANRIARLVAIQQGTEFVLLKHQQGKHDQATHGSWDTDRSNNKKSDFKYGVQDAIDKVIKGEVGKVVPADAEFLLDKMADREDNPDLTNLEIVGTKLFTRDNLGIMRDQMPQVPSGAKDEFLNEMTKRGIGVTRDNVSPQELHPIQAEISASKTGKILRDLNQNGHKKGDGARIVVSSDNYVIDGHHRWAASAFMSLNDSDEKIPILRVDMTHMELIDVVRAWNKTMDIKPIGMGESNTFKKAWVEFELAVIKGILVTEMRKHQAGQHDQSSHGARYFHGSNTDLQIGDYLRPPSETGKSPRSHPDIDPREFNNADYVYLTSSESQAFGYARDLNEGKNYVYEVESIDDNYLEIDPEVDYGFADVGSFRINKPVKIIGKKEIVAKHLSGQHDQSSHGSWSTRLNPEVASNIIRFTQEWGGLSINMVDGSMPTTGYMVSKPPKFGIIVDEVNFSNPVKGPKILSDYMKKQKKDLGTGKNYLGTWLNESKVYLDVSENIQEVFKARRLGRERNQIKIWDVVNQIEIDTGGTGLVEKRSQNGGVEKHLRDDRRRDRRIRTENLEQSSSKEKLTVFVKPPVQKHLAGQHDQESHGSWAGNGLGIQEVIKLHKSSDPLKSKIYDAEQSTETPSVNPLQKPSAPKRDDFELKEDYDKAYKAYSKEWTEWAVGEQTIIFSDTGKKFLNGTPAGVKKYVENVIKQDWFVEKFGDGSSLPKLDVKTSNTNASGRHILGVEKDRYSGLIVKKIHQISIDRQSVKNERTMLHEISHYATAITQTSPFSSHGVEFAKNHVFILEKMAGLADSQALTDAYLSRGIEIGN